MEKQVFHFPRWAIAIYALSVVVLVPWTYSLAEHLPTRQLVHNWDLAWTGLDVFELVLFALTTVLAVRKTIWAALSATALSTILLVDVWFDVLTARPGIQLFVALALAIFFELPIAVGTYILAYRETRHLHNNLQDLGLKST
jgi:hypothetical protein